MRFFIRFVIFKFCVDFFIDMTAGRYKQKLKICLEFLLSCRMYLSGTDMGLPDYDGRTALHLAAAEGHLDCVRFLLEVCNVPLSPKDRYVAFFS